CQARQPADSSSTILIWIGRPAQSSGTSFSAAATRGRSWPRTARPQSNSTSPDLGFCFEQLLPAAALPARLPAGWRCSASPCASARRDSGGGLPRRCRPDRSWLNRAGTTAAPSGSSAGTPCCACAPCWPPPCCWPALHGSARWCTSAAVIDELRRLHQLACSGVMLWFAPPSPTPLHASQPPGPAPANHSLPPRGAAPPALPGDTVVRSWSPAVCSSSSPSGCPSWSSAWLCAVHFATAVPLFLYALTQTPAPRLSAKKPRAGGGGYRTFSTAGTPLSTRLLDLPAMPNRSLKPPAGGLLSDLLFLWLSPLMQRAPTTAAAAAGSSDGPAGGAIDGPDDLPELPPALLHRVGLDDPRLGCRAGGFVQQPLRGASINEDALTESADQLAGPASVAVITQPWRCAGTPPKPPLARAAPGAGSALSACSPMSALRPAGAQLLGGDAGQRGPDWWGGVCVAALVSSTLLAAAASTAFNYRTGLLVLKARSALASLVYRKTLNVPVSAMGQYSSGQALNFLSTDADRIRVNFCPSFHQLWSMPLQIVVVTALLWYQVGLGLPCRPGLYGLLLLPVQAGHRCQDQAERSHDEAQGRRVKLTGEVLRGHPAGEALGLGGGGPAAPHSPPPGRELRALKWRKYWTRSAFTCIALFGMLITPLNALPWVVNGLMEARVSLRRVDNFLRCREMPPQSEAE
uniref:ABC transmembrane type-1 domain-containing protein n=1 Tax=Macrostomum lignano TaxID=282301 RepID=A0A1I8FM62_9PLAT